MGSQNLLITTISNVLKQVRNIQRLREDVHVIQEKKIGKHIFP